jgi:hypothetical protein
VVAWYDNRRGLDNAAGHFKLDVYATYSTDGGMTFAPAFPVNDQTPDVNTPNGNIFDPDPGAVNYREGPPPTTRIGEYFGLGIWGGTAYVAWNGNTFAGFDNPTGQQVWTKAFAIRGSLTITTPPGDDYITIRTMPDNPAFVEVIVNGQRRFFSPVGLAFAVFASTVPVAWTLASGLAAFVLVFFAVFLADMSASSIGRVLASASAPTRPELGSSFGEFTLA